ncbi:hypothetical protein [Luteibacter sp. 329MFSha]|uniref:hypothetical protein n=1 Tax=Luteibacter sp. 329MFSha TaxID=1798239 RepID=UPI001113BB21|nr:hypothetical protein [Luteibacter sp. 329MFSha]
MTGFTTRIVHLLAALSRSPHSVSFNPWRTATVFSDRGVRRGKSVVPHSDPGGPMVAYPPDHKGAG